MGTKPTRSEFNGVSGIQALGIAGMAWGIKESALMAGDVQIPDKKALFRDDNGGYLGTVGSGYEARSYTESMVPTIDLLSKEGGAHVQGPKSEAQSSKPASRRAGADLNSGMRFSIGYPAAVANA